MHSVVGQMGYSLLGGFVGMGVDVVYEAGCRCYGWRFIAEFRGGWT